MRNGIHIKLQRFWLGLLIPALACLVVAAFSLSAQDRAVKKESVMASPFAVQPEGTLINAGNIALWIHANGRSANFPNADHGAFYPRGTAGVIYQDGFLWGGIVRDGMAPAVRVGGQTYLAGTQPGRIIAQGIAENPEAPNVNHVWRIIRPDYWNDENFLRKDAVEFYRKSFEEINYDEIQALRERYLKDWDEWPWQKGAPFYDTGEDGLFDRDEPGYDPIRNPDPNRDNFPAGAEGDGIKQAREQPGIANADQVAWLVYNDLDPRQTYSLAGSPPIGLEVQVTLWGYRRFAALANVIFKQVRLIYKGTAGSSAGAVIDSMYFGQWSDPDIGYAGDDFVGCDTLLNLGYAYNAAEVDSAFYRYYLPPPTVGYALLAGPLIPSPGSEGIAGMRNHRDVRNLGMSVFTFGRIPFLEEPPTVSYLYTQQWWNIMRGFNAFPLNPPEPLRDPKGNITKFVFPGDPVAGTGWTDTQPSGDRRMLLASGPFKIALGDTNEILVAVVGGLGYDRLSSLSAMKHYSRVAQSALDNLFNLPESMPTPNLSAVALDSRIILSWAETQAEFARIEQPDKNGYQFEGYNVYQLPSAQAQLSEGVKLATFDRNNNVRRIVEERFDPSLGLVAPAIVQDGTDSGVQRSLQIKWDALNTYKLLANGRKYYFALTAYNYHPRRPIGIASVESAPAIIAATPHGLDPGVRLGKAIGDTLPVLHAKGHSEGNVKVVVVDPTRLTGDDYKVTFVENAQGEIIWNLLNQTKETTVLSGMTNQSGDGDYLITDGVQAIVSGPPLGVKEASFISGSRWWTWAGGADGFHLEGLNGAIGWGGSYPFNTSTVKSYQLENILIKFAATEVNGNPLNPNDPNISYAYRYLANASASPARPEFARFIVNPTGDFSFQDFTKSVPWAAFIYHAETQAVGQRLSLGFLENNASGGLVDGKWWPPVSFEANNTMESGPREWFWIFNLPYSETPDPLLGASAATMVSGEPKPILFWGTVARRGQVGGNAGDQLAIRVYRPNSADDEFVFKSVAPQYDRNLAREDVLRQVKVFPNPFYGVARQDLLQANRYVTISHLPPKADIRIFTLNGWLVRKIGKNDDSQFSRWDLLNESGRLVAPGMYVVHIDMPELGVSKTLKLAVVF